MMLLRWLAKEWRKRLRSLDMALLWPEFLREARDTNHAKAAFMFHCVRDSAWTKDYSEADLVSFINALEPKA